MKNKQTYHTWTFFLCFGVLLLLILGITIAFQEGFKDASENVMLAFKIILPIVALLWLILIIIPGFQQVEPNEIGVIIQFGKPMFQVDSGFIFVPYPPVWRLEKETSLVLQE